VKGSAVDYASKTLTMKVGEGYDEAATLAALKTAGFGGTPQ